MRKRVLSWIGALALMVGLGGAAFAQRAPIVIKGDYVLRGSVLVQYQGNDAVVTIPANLGITEIGSEAFIGNKTITSVIIPPGVISIGQYAFYNCGKLTSVTIPAGAAYIGESAFAYSGLNSVTIPSSVTYIGEYAFAACQNLTGVTLSRQTQTGAGAFPAGVSIGYGSQTGASSDFVQIPGGTFTMGSSESESNRDADEVQHRVTINTFYLSKYEVTQKDYQSAAGRNPSYFKGETLPVENVNWYDAVAYCNFRSQREGLTPAYTVSGTTVTWNRNADGYRLPTEAEWEYACRAGTTGAFHTGNSITVSQANYNGNRGQTWAVGSGASNAWGLYDMHGNVWEWCWDWYDVYSKGSQTNPAGADTGSARVFRGGSWGYDSKYARSAFRGNGTVDGRFYNLGFRLARNAGAPSASSQTAAVTPAPVTPQPAPAPVAPAPAPRPQPAPASQPAPVTSAPASKPAPAPTTRPAASPNPGVDLSISNGASSAKPAVQLTSAGFARIPGGTFTMGSPESEPERYDHEVQHSVTISAFSLSKYEVTQKDYQEAMGNNPSYLIGDNLPVERVSWFDAIAYCNFLSKREGLTPAYTVSGTTVTWNRNADGYRLPTEAEWEYACRAGTTTPFHTGNSIAVSQANFNGEYPYNGGDIETSLDETWAVGSGAANAWGLYDMHGNVWEWCWDWYGKYSSAVQTDPAGAGSGLDRVLRGGSWSDDGGYLRSAVRLSSDPSIKNSGIGFRLARSVK